jgi:hypothetical protein
MLLVADHYSLVTQRWDIRVGTSQKTKNPNYLHLITLTYRQT